MRSGASPSPTACGSTSEDLARTIHEWSGLVRLGDGREEGGPQVVRLLAADALDPEQVVLGLRLVAREQRQRAVVEDQVRRDLTLAGEVAPKPAQRLEQGLVQGRGVLVAR